MFLYLAMFSFLLSLTFDFVVLALAYLTSVYFKFLIFSLSYMEILSYDSVKAVYCCSSAFKKMMDGKGWIFVSTPER